MSALLSELFRIHGPFALLAPDPYTGAAVRVTRRGGGTYEVRDLATLRNGAVDMLDWGIHFSALAWRAIELEQSLRADNRPASRWAKATAMLIQQDAAAAYELSARWHKASGLPIGRDDLVINIYNQDGTYSRTETIRTADELLAFAQRQAAVPADYFRTNPSLRRDATLDVAVSLREPPPENMRAAQVGVVAAAPLVVQGLIVVGGVLVIGWTLRTVLAWIAPAAAGQARAHQAALAALQEAHERRVDACEAYPPLSAERERCIAAANQQLLEELDAANRLARRGQWADSLVKIGAVAAVAAVVAAVRGGRRRA